MELDFAHGCVLQRVCNAVRNDLSNAQRINEFDAFHVVGYRAEEADPLADHGTVRVDDVTDERANFDLHEKHPST